MSGPRRVPAEGASPGRWAWLLVVVAAACTLGTGALLRAQGIGLWSATALGNGFPGVDLATVVGVLVGAVILSRQPRHPIGWLFCLGQLGVALGLLGGAAGDALLTGAVSAPHGLGVFSAWVGDFLGSDFALVLLSSLLLLVPDGQLPSRRWWPVPVLLVLSLLLSAAVLVGFRATGAEQTASGLASALLLAAFVAVSVALVLSAVSLVVRLRHSVGERRQQLRWIAAASALLAAVPVVAVTINLSGRVTPVWVILSLHVAYLAVPVATGLAVLRYRLYDVDRIIGGSVVLAVLVVLGGVGYVVVVGLAHGLVPGEASSTWSSLAVFVVVVLAFQPVRRTARRLADRVVYGHQSMSYDALTTFTRRLTASAPRQPFLAGLAEASARLVAAERCEARLELEDGTVRSATWPSTLAEGPSPPTWVVPLRRHGTEIGVLLLTVPELAAGGQRRRHLLADFTERMGPALEHARLELSLRVSADRLAHTNRQLAESRSRLLAAKDIGRRHVAGTIQRDVVGPLEPALEALAAVAASTGPDAARPLELVDTAMAATAEAIQQLRRITSTVYSRRLVEEGLVAALRGELAGPVQPSPVSGPDARWPPSVESCLFACCMDLIHRGGGGARFEVLDEGQHAVVAITWDDAEGLVDPEWLAMTRERVEALDGAVVGDGAHRVVLEVPVSGSPSRRG
jgi:hypothetical protein